MDEGEDNNTNDCHQVSLLSGEIDRRIRDSDHLLLLLCSLSDLSPPHLLHGPWNHPKS